ncbi:MAG: non-reducing end alpha-L-arabinofuranosidase family hydrolase [Acidobacteriaceae bacterium]|nr:non-reducing end alpha-L-arabinofuranosidase family hydrolase [Acidobacteriaceae bacterium]
MTSCSAGGSPSGSSTPIADSLSLSLSNSTITVSAGGAIGRVTANVMRTNSTGSISLAVSGLPTGASVLYDQQPGTGSTGVIAFNPGTAAAGSYALTVQATDGTATTTSISTLVIGPGTASLLSTPIVWASTAPVISAVSNATHSIVAIKDPSVVYYNNKWHVYATTADSAGNYNMAYFSFTDWSSASSATPYYMDATSGFSGYHCAPQVFYFAPQSKWYLIYQSGPPQYSTTSDITQPSTWTKPQSFFASQPSNVPNWIDFWVICDSSNCYMFFSGDDGRFWRSQTTIGNFPSGFGTPVLVMQAANAHDLFEATNVYALKGLNQYLTLIEAMDSTTYHRYFRAFISTALDGDLTPISAASSWSHPFAGINNVTFGHGITSWTNDISHGEMLRDGYDQTMTIDSTKLQYLYQGVSPSTPSSTSYGLLPWQLGILTRTN